MGGGNLAIEETKKQQQFFFIFLIQYKPDTHNLFEQKDKNFDILSKIQSMLWRIAY